MLLFKRLLLLLVLLVASCQALEGDAGNNVYGGDPRILSPEKHDSNGLYSVYFIPAYRLTTNKTARDPEPTTARPVLAIDPRVSARLVSAAFTAAVRNASAASLRQHTTTPAPRFTQLMQKQPQDSVGAQQHHDAHIYVTVTTPSNPSGPPFPSAQSYAAGSTAPSYYNDGPPFGPNSAHHYNYPNEVSAHYGARHPYPIPGPVPYGHGHYGPAASLLAHYQALAAAAQPRYNAAAAASSLDVVSSPPIAVQHALAATGSVSATPDKPPSTVTQSQSATTSMTTTVEPDTTTTVTTIKEPSSSGSAAVSSTVSPTTPSEDVQTINQTFELSRTNQRQKLNISGQVEVTSGNARNLPSDPTISSKGVGAETPKQETQPTKDSASAAKDQSATSAQPPLRPDQPVGQHHGSPQHPHPAVFQVPNGFVLGGYNPPDYANRYSTHAPARPPPNDDPYQQGGRFSNGFVPNPTQPSVTNPTYSGRFFPFHDNLVPGFAPGYPFGVSPYQDGRNQGGFPGRPQGGFPVKPEGGFPAYQQPGGRPNDNDNRENDVGRIPSKGYSPNPGDPSGPGEDPNAGYQTPPRQHFSNTPGPVSLNYPYNNSPFGGFPIRPQGGFPVKPEGSFPAFRQPGRRPDDDGNRDSAEDVGRNPAKFQSLAVGGPTGSGEDPNAGYQAPPRQHFSGIPGSVNTNYQYNNNPFQQPGVGFATPAPFVRPFNQNQQPLPVNPEYNRFSDDYLSPGRGQRLPTFYSGPLPNQQSQDGVGPTRIQPPSVYNPQQGSHQGFGQPFGILNPFYANDKSDAVGGQTQLKSYVSDPGEKLVSARYDVKGSDVINGVLGGVVGAIAAAHTVARREDQNQHRREFRVGFFGGPST